MNERNMLLQHVDDVMESSKSWFSSAQDNMLACSPVDQEAMLTFMTKRGWECPDNTTEPFRPFNKYKSFEDFIADRRIPLQQFILSLKDVCPPYIDEDDADDASEKLSVEEGNSDKSIKTLTPLVAARFAVADYLRLAMHHWQYKAKYFNLWEDTKEAV